MKNLTIAFLAVAGLSLFGSGVSSAKAQGLHFSTRGLHIDVGRPHSYFDGYYYGRPAVRVAPRAYYRPVQPHYDYIPSRVVPHGDHFDILPAQYRLHYGGHGSIYRGSRHGRHGGHGGHGRYGGHGHRR